MVQEGAPDLARLIPRRWTEEDWIGLFVKLFCLFVGVPAAVLLGIGVWAILFRVAVLIWKG